MQGQGARRNYFARTGGSDAGVIIYMRRLGHLRARAMSRYNCKACGGSAFCEHGRQRSRSRARTAARACASTGGSEASARSAARLATPPPAKIPRGAGFRCCVLNEENISTIHCPPLSILARTSSSHALTTLSTNPFSLCVSPASAPRLLSLRASSSPRAFPARRTPPPAPPGWGRPCARKSP